MASATFGDSDGDLNSREKHSLTKYDIVYTRRTGKRAHKLRDNFHTATCKTSVAEKPNVDNPSSPERVELSSAVLATTADADVSLASNHENFNSSVTGFSPHALAARPSGPTDTHSSAEDNVGHEPPEAPLKTNVIVKSCNVLDEQYHQEQNISQEAADRDADTLPGQPEHDHPTPLLLHGSCTTPNGVENSSCIQTAELQNLGEPPVLRIDDAKKSEKPSPTHHDNEIIQTGGVKSGSLIGLSQDDLPSCTEVDLGQIPTENNELNGELIPGSNQGLQGNGPVDDHGSVKPLAITSFDDWIRFNLGKSSSKDEVKDLSDKLESDLDHVRRLCKQFEARELQATSYDTQLSNNKLGTNSKFVSAESLNNAGYNHRQAHAQSDLIDRRVLLRVNQDVGATAHQEGRPVGLSRVNSDVGAARSLEPRPYNRQLSVAVMETNHRIGDFVEKEKRTPKANQFYRNSEFLLGKDRLPPESNKRLKTNNGRKHGGETGEAFGYGFGFDKNRNQFFRNCSSILQRLMKHKFGWVFNEPVNAKALGLVDYHDIIKHPMDLGTIKGRLSQNWYKSPREFAEDVRLVFCNAMTYNPKGQDVHIMAEQLAEIFEERWAIIETEYNDYWKYQLYQDGRLTTAASRKSSSQSYFAPSSFVASAAAPIPGYIAEQASSYVSTPVPLHAPVTSQMRSFDWREPLATSVSGDPQIQRPHFVRAPVPRKPKAKDPNKRDMTEDEKKRLSNNLQGLPVEKLDAIVQIIKKRNTAVSQHDDEIEVDIDNVDPETLWELDRFVTNYKKSLSKNKRKAELALQARTNQNATLLVNSTPATTGVKTISRGAIEKSTGPEEGENGRGHAESRSSSSSSSSSDSGSSSSDSDSDSSSADGSEAGQSPRSQRDMIKEHV